jgi:pimeloyl-ACP methyl ester carboxylesterase
MSVKKEGTTPSRRVLPRRCQFAVLLIASCASPATLRVQDPTPPSLAAELRLGLPVALESERVSYQSEIVSARDQVASWFAANGIAVDPAEIVNTAVVFADVLEAKRYMSKHFGIPEDKIPDGFSGTVDGKTLFVVARETYARTYARLYPDHSWTDDAYQSLITHELAHRAHAVKSQTLFGSEEGMGPRWFFEGLAITCASQFADRPLPWLAWDDLRALMNRDATETLSYPLYGQMFRSLTASFPVKWLVEHAGQSEFSRVLQDEYLPSEFVLETPSVPLSRGTVLLVHGSAPFDLDGRIPVADLGSSYAKTAFYRDLAADLRAAGWSVLRYSKPGVHENGVDSVEYAKTDLALLSRQLRNLWRFLPTDRPRVVFAWSEGSLHVHALPREEMDAVILLGGISTNIGDVVRAQGGPTAEELKKELANRSRRDMLGLDRPVGRMLDELDLADNWKSFEASERLPILILHGADDREVPVSQAAVWKETLPLGRINVVQGEGLDHRFMASGVYDTSSLTKEVTGWLDGVFPETRR